MRPTHRPLRRWLAAGTMAASGVLAGTPALAGSDAAASPIGDAQAKVAAIEAQLQLQGQRISALDEQYNQARLALSTTQSELSATSVQADQARQKVDQARRQLKADAVDAFMLDTPVSSFGLLLTGPASEQGIRRQYAETAAGNQAEALGQYRASQDHLVALEGRLQSEQRAAQAAASAIQQSQAQAVAANQSEEAALGQVKGQLAELVAAQEAATAQENAAKAQAQANQQHAAAFASRSSQAAQVAQEVSAASGNRQVAQLASQAESAASGAAHAVAPAPSRGPSLPAAPPAAGGGAAVAAAERELGKPYVWGGAGPDGFDCSGLTMVAWRAAGVRLDHSAAAQYAEITHVPMSNLQPGDLIFYDFGGGTIDHVTMYVGHGTVIQAAHTGTNVEFSPIWYSGLVGAGRP